MFGLVPFSRRNDNLLRRNDYFGINKLFDDFFNDEFFTRWQSPVKADIRETEKEWIIDAEMPGVDKNNINVEVNDGYLTISVDQKNEVNEENENYVRRERFCGNYSRSFYLDNVDQDKIKAAYKDGILTLNLPKAEPEKKRKVEIDIQ